MLGFKTRTGWARLSVQPHGAHRPFIPIHFRHHSFQHISSLPKVHATVLGSKFREYSAGCMSSGNDTLRGSTLEVRRWRTSSTLNTSVTLYNGPAKHHHRNNTSRPLHRHLPPPPLRPPVPAATKIAPNECNSDPSFTSHTICTQRGKNRSGTTNRLTR